METSPVTLDQQAAAALPSWRGAECRWDRDELDRMGAAINAGDLDAALTAWFGSDGWLTEGEPFLSRNRDGMLAALTAAASASVTETVTLTGRLDVYGAHGWEMVGRPGDTVTVKRHPGGTLVTNRQGVRGHVLDESLTRATHAPADTL